MCERRVIEFALSHGETIRKSAVLLGISSNFLGERLRVLGIPAPDSKPGPKPGTKRPPPKLRVIQGEDHPLRAISEEHENEEPNEPNEDEAEDKFEDEDIDESEEEFDDEDEDVDDLDDEDVDDEDDEDDTDDEDDDQDEEGSKTGN